MTASRSSIEQFADILDDLIARVPGDENVTPKQRAEQVAAALRTITGSRSVESTAEEIARQIESRHGL